MSRKLWSESAMSIHSRWTVTLVLLLLLGMASCGSEGSNQTVTDADTQSDNAQPSPSRNTAGGPGSKAQSNNVLQETELPKSGTKNQKPIVAVIISNDPN